MSTESERERRRRIKEKIRKLKDERKEYKEYKEDFEDGKKKFEKSYNGIQHLKVTQYNTVISDCEEAIGDEVDLFEALQVENINMDQVVSDIIDEVNNGIASIQDKIDSINEKISNLESQL